MGSAPLFEQAVVSQLGVALEHHDAAAHKAVLLKHVLHALVLGIRVDADAEDAALAAQIADGLKHGKGKPAAHNAAGEGDSVHGDIGHVLAPGALGRQIRGIFVKGEIHVAGRLPVEQEQPAAAFADISFDERRTGIFLGPLGEALLLLEGAAFAQNLDAGSPPAPSKIPPKYLVTTTKTSLIPDIFIAFKTGIPAVPCGSLSSEYLAMLSPITYA